MTDIVEIGTTGVAIIFCAAGVVFGVLQM